MNCLTEVLGMGLPGNGTIPAAYQGARIALAKRAGAKIMDLVAQNLCPRDIMTMDAFENAITVDMAIGGSSNTALHLPAIAHEADLELPLELFDEISKKTPYLTKLSPGGSHHIIDLNEAGGINAVMHELSKLDLIHKEAKSVTGQTMGENFADAVITRPDVIHSVENPYRKTGGIAVLKGNISPDCSVVKESAVAEEMLVHSGPAKVYDSEDEAIAAICGKQIEKGDVVVIRYEGPKADQVCAKCSIPHQYWPVWDLIKMWHSLRMGVFPARPAGPASVIFPLKHVKAVILHLYKTVISSKSIFPTAHLMLSF
mgnify:CR=1 FL=1